MRQRRRCLLGSLLAVVTILTPLAPFAARAAPTVIEESFRLGGPGDSNYFGVPDLALDGNRLVVLTRPQTGSVNVWVYERTPNVENQWSAATPVLSASHPERVEQPRVAVQGDIIALSFRGRLIVAERSSSGWSVTASFTAPPGVAEMGSDVEIDNGVIVVGGETGNYQALIYRKNASGVWAYVGQVTGGSRQQDAGNFFFGGDVDISGDTIAVGSPYHSPDGTSSGSVYLFTNTGAGWIQSAALQYPLSEQEPSNWASHVALDGDRLIVTHSYVSGAAYFYRRTNGVWSFASVHEPNNMFSGGQDIPAALSGNLIAKQLNDPVRGGGRVLIYSQQGSQLVPVADLKHIEYTNHDFARMDISGRMVAVSGIDRVLIFDIPEALSQPEIIQDNFQDGNANGWQPDPVSNWSVASSGTARVYRQTLLASGARSVLTGSDWTNQSISALIKPTAFDGSDRWFGLATRYTDPSNYYYITLRSSNTILLRRMANGVYTTLASDSLTVAPNQTYAVRLEAIGTRLRVYVNNQLRLEAIDATLRHGQAALMTYRTRADFDNVVVTPNPLNTLFRDFFSHPTGAWTPTLDGVWIEPPDSIPDPDFPDPHEHQRNYAQTSTAGGARSHTGVTTEDQIVQARVRPDALTPTGWFGVMARYIDDGNFYYLKVGAAGTASIRKLVNGAIFELASAPFPVSADTWYTLRLETVGNQVRAYLNDRLLMETNDSSHAAGKYGLVTYRAAATFDDVDIKEP